MRPYILKIVRKTIRNRQLGKTNLLKELPSQLMLERGPITTKKAQSVTPERAKKLYATETASFVSSIALYTKLPGSVIWLLCRA